MHLEAARELVEVKVRHSMTGMKCSKRAVLREEGGARVRKRSMR